MLFRSEIKQAVVRVDAFQQVLDAETLAADMLHLALVLFVDGVNMVTNGACPLQVIRVIS